MAIKLPPVQFRERLLAAFSWARANATYDWLRFFLAAVLLAAAVFKGVELTNGGDAGRRFWDSRSFLTFLVLIELATALWLVFGLYSQWTRWSVIVLFLLFMEYSLFQGLAGEKTCKCLGKVQISPWLMVAFDALVIWCLLVVPHSSAPMLWSSTRFLGFLALFVFLGVPALHNMVFFEPYRGATIELRRDTKLDQLIPVDLRSPSTEEIIAQLQSKTGLVLTIEPRLQRDIPQYGRIGPTKLKAFSIMEFLAQKQSMPARWEKSESGYHLRGTVPLGNRRTPWVISACIGAVLLIGVGIWRIRARKAPAFSDPNGGVCPHGEKNVAESRPSCADPA